MQIAKTKQTRKGAKTRRSTPPFSPLMIGGLGETESAPAPAEQELQKLYEQKDIENIPTEKEKILIELKNIVKNTKMTFPNPKDNKDPQDTMAAALWIRLIQALEKEDTP